MNLVNIVEKSKNDLLVAGSEKSFGSIYEALAEEILVTCIDGVVHRISITGCAQEMPSFCGVRIG